MKIRDIITEAPSKFRKGHRTAIKGMVAYPDLDNGNVPYLQYRFGLMLAGAPDVITSDHGPTGGRLITLAYTDADEEIINSASKAFGVEQLSVTSKKSSEPDLVNKKSVVRSNGPIALKKKK